MKKVELLTIQLRLEGIRHSITRARFTLLISMIASIAIFVTAWNAYLSSDSFFGTLHYWSQDKMFTKEMQQDRMKEITDKTLATVTSPTQVTDYIQQQIVSEWVKNQIISVGLLGIRISVGDLSLIGSLSLFIISAWLFFSVRRENRAIGTLLKYGGRFQDWNVRYMIYQGIVHYLVLVDFGRGDKPISDFSHSEEGEIYHVPFIRGVVKLLFLLPPISILFSISMDVWTLFRQQSPFRPSEGRLWFILDPSDKYWLGGNLAVALFLFFLTTFYCLKTLKFTNATGEFINKFRKKLVKDWEDLNKKEDADSDLKSNLRQ
jgi:hypothetical protein